MSASTAHLNATALAALGAVLLLARSATALEISADEIQHSAREYMKEQVRSREFSGAVLLAREGKILFSQAYGYANAEWRIPNTTATRFRIASLTKQFTAAAVLLLQEDHRLEVKNAICGYLAHCPQAWSTITIHQLLTHTSGIPSYTDANSYEEYRSRAIRPTIAADLIDSLQPEPLDFAPGERMKYSNSGYLILGHIIEKVSGEDYASFLQRRIFAPLGMADTGYDRHERLVERRASGYSSRAGTKINADYIDMSYPYAAGALYSTVGDLLTWNEALHTGRLLAKESLATMLTPVQNNYGYGVYSVEKNGRRLVHHSGGIAGFSTFLARYPHERVSVVVLRNTDYGAADPAFLSANLAAIAFGEKHAPE